MYACHTAPYHLITNLSWSPLDDFFVGIGDINSAHLPVIAPPVGAAPLPILAQPPTSVTSSTTTLGVLASTPDPSLPTSSSTSSSLGPSDLQELSPTEEAKVTALQESKDVQDAVLSKAQSLVIESVVHERPLAKLQEALDHEAEVGSTVTDDKDKGIEANGEVEKLIGDALDGEVEDEDKVTVPSQKVKHKMLLHNNDSELLRIEDASETCFCLLHLSVINIIASYRRSLLRSIRISSTRTMHGRSNRRLST